MKQLTTRILLSIEGWVTISGFLKTIYHWLLVSLLVHNLNLLAQNVQSVNPRLQSERKINEFASTEIWQKKKCITSSNSIKL